MKFLKESWPIILGTVTGSIAYQLMFNQSFNVLECIGLSLVCIGSALFFRTWWK